jgi:hypothetical protein
MYLVLILLKSNIKSFQSNGFDFIIILIKMLLLKKPCFLIMHIIVHFNVNQLLQST